MRGSIRELVVGCFPLKCLDILVSQPVDQRFEFDAEEREFALIAIELRHSIEFSDVRL